VSGSQILSTSSSSTGIQSTLEALDGSSVLCKESLMSGFLNKFGKGVKVANLQSTPRPTTHFETGVFDRQSHCSDVTSYINRKYDLEGFKLLSGGRCSDVTSYKILKLWLLRKEITIQLLYQVLLYRPPK
jgi:hypothetical protein